MRIPIVMVSDENYISQTRVTIWSMRKSTHKDVILDITVLCSSCLNGDSKSRLMELESIWLNLKIHFYEVNSKIFSKAPTVAHIPVTSFYRLLLPEVLKDEKCLFLDGDLIVDTDLRNLYLQDMGEAYIAGVRDGGIYYDPEGVIEHVNQYGFKNLNTYVNAGVMVFNLVKIREDNLQDIFLKNLETYYPYMDQDIINKVCDGKIKLLDSKYNCFNRCKKANGKLDNQKSDSKEWEILHFAGADKPWNNFRVRGAREWWGVAKEALEEEVYSDMYNYAYLKALQNDWSYILERCLKEKIIIIVGYSRIGIDVFYSLKRCDVLSEIYFCDNSKIKQNISDDVLSIYSVEELAERFPDALWINTSQRSYLDINNQLKNIGVFEKRILVYRNKGEMYFEMLDDTYIEYELEQIKLKNLGNTN